MKTRKSPGVDGISAEVYKALPDNLVNLLTEIFNEILVTGEYPASWSVGLNCSIYKVGEKEEPNNYRGITLLNCIGKIFTSILNTTLKNWAEKNKYISRRTVWLQRKSKNSGLHIHIEYID